MNDEKLPIGEEFIRKNDIGNYIITNLGALLFAKNLNNFRHLKRKAIRVVQYNGTGRIQADREKVFEQGYAICFSDICDYINAHYSELLKDADAILDSICDKAVPFLEKYF